MKVRGLSPSDVGLPALEWYSTLVLACCKVGLDRPLIPTAVVANWFRSARVFRPRRSADRRSPGDAPTVGDRETCGRGGRAGQEVLREPATGRACSMSTTSVNRRRPPSMPRAELGINGLKSLGRDW